MKQMNLYQDLKINIKDLENQICKGFQKGDVVCPPCSEGDHQLFQLSIITLEEKGPQHQLHKHNLTLLNPLLFTKVSESSKSLKFVFNLSEKTSLCKKPEG